MTDPMALLQRTLHYHGQFMTAPREAVFIALLDSEPLSMHELIRKCGNKADRSSVYRTIKLYEELGIIQRLYIGWKYRVELSDDFQHHHHHLNCSRCGRTYPLPEDDELESRLHFLAKQTEFMPESHQLEIRGICRNCQS